MDERHQEPLEVPDKDRPAIACLRRRLRKHGAAEAAESGVALDMTAST